MPHMWTYLLKRTVIEMGYKIINNIPVIAIGEITDDEISIYLTQLQAKNKFKIISAAVTMIVGFSAGGGADLLARSLEKLSIKYLGQSLVVINKPG